MDYERKSFKLSTKFFDNRKTQLILGKENGATYIVIWLKMLALAGQRDSNGALYVTDDVPYTPDELSTVMREPVETIIKALYLFKKYSMVLISDDGVITIKNWDKYQNPEEDEYDEEEDNEEWQDSADIARRREATRKRVADYRARKRGCNSDVTQCNAECNANVTLESVTCNADVTKNGFSPPTPPYIYNNISSTSPEESNKPRKIFVKPTVDEVADYCEERKNGISAEAFIDHYESNGWKVGRNPMKDWKAAVRTWERTRKEGNGYGQNNRDRGKTDAGPRTKYDLKPRFAGHKYNADGNDITGT